MSEKGQCSVRVNMYLLVLLVGIFVQITCCYVYGNGSMCVPEKHSALFVFGDSLYDAGINNYINTTSYSQANYPPYGQTFFNYPNGRFSDGRVIPDFIAEYAKLPLIFPYMHPNSEDTYMYGVNFASAGAGALVETTPGYVVDLHTQVSYYKNVRNVLRKKIGNAEARALISNAVHLISSIGGNDYAQRFLTNSTVYLPYSQQQFVDIVIGNITTAIKEIHKEGGRKFGFVNMGSALGCSPGVRILLQEEGKKCNEEMLAVARLHNEQLAKMLVKLQKQLKGFKYSLFDLYYSATQLTNYPSQYGFKEGEVACCGSGAYRGEFSCGGKRGIEKYELCENVNDYVYFDSDHPTDKASHHISYLMWAGNRTYNSPYNLNHLFQL